MDPALAYYHLKEPSEVKIMTALSAYKRNNRGEWLILQRGELSVKKDCVAEMDRYSLKM